jgi:predicted MPP superfamily phosphohydrolase
MGEAETQPRAAGQWVNRIEVPLRRLPAGLDGLTVALVADVHASRGRGGDAAVHRVIDIVNAAGPDLVVLLGDIVHHGRDGPRYLPLLSRLHAPCGVFACLGNHEHGFVWYSRYLGPSPTPAVDEWRQLYANAGVRLLVNESARVERHGALLWLVGVDDVYSRHDDLPAALQQVPDGAFRLAITHSPDLVDDPRANELDLIVAGHTHGGQVHVPGIGAIAAPCRHPRTRAAGLLHVGSTTLYVSRGLGEGLPIRLGCPRELPVLVLRTTAGE